MIFGPLYTNTHVGYAYDGTTNFYHQNKGDIFLTFLLTSAYTAATQFEVWSAPDDPAAPVGICRPLIASETKVQYKEPNCPGFSVNVAGDLILKLSAPNVAPAADQVGVPAIAAGDSVSINVRIPQCPGRSWLTLKPVGAAAGVRALFIHPSSAR